MLEQERKRALKRRAARVMRIDGEDRSEGYPGKGRLKLSGFEAGVLELDEDDGKASGKWFDPSTIRK